jgi:formylglycine-generating enzyme required for sulfatase activity
MRFGYEAHPVRRGGSWGFGPVAARSIFRAASSSRMCSLRLGLRLVRRCA